jgi:hypothetical protein
MAFSVIANWRLDAGRIPGWSARERIGRVEFSSGELGAHERAGCRAPGVRRIVVIKLQALDDVSSGRSPVTDLIAREQVPPISQRAVHRTEPRHRLMPKNSCHSLAARRGHRPSQVSL